MEKAFADIIKKIGEDPTRDGLLDTPARAAKAFEFLTEGYRRNVKDVVNDALFESDCNEMVVVSDIELYSLCEVLGLSKVARIVDLYARRLQIQEGLTTQIANTMMEVTGAEGVGVIIEARHMCMMMRGVEKQNSVMRTSAMLGAFKDNQATRTEFLSLINM